MINRRQFIHSLLCGAPVAVIATKLPKSNSYAASGGVVSTSDTLLMGEVSFPCTISHAKAEIIRKHNHKNGYFQHNPNEIEYTCRFEAINPPIMEIIQ